MTEDLEILQGAISAVVYQNYENGYAVQIGRASCRERVFALV